MPDWDEGYRAYAYQSGVQNLGHVDLGEWMVYLFCDETTFVASNPAMTDLLLGRYDGPVDKVLHERSITCNKINVLVSKEPEVSMPDWDEGW